MKVIIAGSRKGVSFAEVKAAIQESGFKITEVCSGEAPGVDTLGETWANNRKIPVKPFPAHWDDLDAPGAYVVSGHYGDYNANAGKDRNQLMANYAEALIAVRVQGKSSGTDDMIERATKAGLKVFVRHVDASKKYCA